jgi:hypothetical protein
MPVSPLSRNDGQLSLSAAAGSRYTDAPIDRAREEPRGICDGIAMRRLLMIVPVLIVLAACAGAPPQAAGPQQGVRATFPAGSVVNVIRIDALDPAPLRAAALVAPDGTTTEATSLDVDANPQTLGGQYSLSDPWRNSMLGNVTDPLPSGATDPVARSRTQLLLTVSTADIALPDPVAYRRDWANYKIRLGFGERGRQLDTREIPAPRPPPEAAGS